MPVFVFGQTDAYGWAKLGPPAVPQELAERLARAIGFLPLFMYGVWGTPLPRKVFTFHLSQKVLNISLLFSM